MQEMTMEEVDQVNGGIIMILLLSIWASQSNGGAYTQDLGAGAWG